MNRIIHHPPVPKTSFPLPNSGTDPFAPERGRHIASTTSLSSLATQSGSRRGSVLDESEDASLKLLPSPSNDVDFSHVELL